MRLTVHTVVKNEDRWVWFALQAVLPVADQILIYDTGSTDKTVEIIKSIKSPKVVFEEKGEVDRRGLVKLRQEQLDKTKTDWFLIVDGDEIWPKNQLDGTLQEIAKSIANSKAVVSKTRNCIGDVYHYLDKSSGRYRFGDKIGHFNIRFIKKSRGLKIIGEYPLEAYTDSDGAMQDQLDKLIFSKYWYLHTNFLKRSSSDNQKKSGSLGKSKIWEKGLKMTKSDLPEIFHSKRPQYVINPLADRGVVYDLGASLTTPLLRIKRKVR